MEQKDGVVSFEREKVRYILKYTDEKLQFWIEDMKTKHQWQTPEMEMKDIVNSTNIITNAQMKDYVVRFISCLDSAEADAHNLRSLTSTNELTSSRTLNCSVILQSGAFSTTLKYSFSLEPIPLEKVDLIEAQMRDFRDEIVSLKDSLNEMRNAIDHLEVDNVGCKSDRQRRGYY